MIADAARKAGAEIERLKEKNAPVADAVKVVRCKDCFYAEEREDPVLGSILVCRHRPSTSIVSSIVRRDFCCSYGEKREGSPAEGQHDK